MYVAKNTFEIMRPFVVVTRIFGLCPVTFEQKGAYFIMKRSVKYILYSYVLAIVLGKYYYNPFQDYTALNSVHSADGGHQRPEGGRKGVYKDEVHEDEVHNMLWYKCGHHAGAVRHRVHPLQTENLLEDAQVFQHRKSPTNY